MPKEHTHKCSHFPLQSTGWSCVGASVRASGCAPGLCYAACGIVREGCSPRPRRLQPPRSSYPTAWLPPCCPCQDACDVRRRPEGQGDLALLACQGVQVYQGLPVVPRQVMVNRVLPFRPACQVRLPHPAFRAVPVFQASHQLRLFLGVQAFQACLRGFREDCGNLVGLLVTPLQVVQADRAGQAARACR